ncbi:MAG: response regulator, partial [Acidobacteriota bacterium]
MKAPEPKLVPLGAKPSVLVVDDENGPRQALRMLLKEDYEVIVTDSVDAALAILERTPVDLVITDIRMPKRTGVDLLREAKAAHPDVQIIVLTGYGQLETAVKAVEYGAFSYMEKPFDNEVMLNLVSSAIQKHREEKHRRALEFLALEANRFATLGRVVSGMMHDLGSPLTVLGSQLELLSRETLTPELSVRVETMRRQVTHCTDLVRSTMNFLRKQQAGDVPVSLNDIVQSCVKLAAPLLREFSVEVHQDLDSNLRTISGDVVLLRQALLNLL